MSLLEIVDLEFETTFEDMPELKYLESKLINQVEYTLYILYYNIITQNKN